LWQAEAVGARGIYVEIEIAAPLERVWELSQAPEAHGRWDLRFSAITPLEERVDGEPYRFRYERALPLHTIVGTGIALGERESAASGRTSALRFTTDDRLSPLRDGRGYWRYTPTAGGTLFVTGYDYRPGWGAAIDRVVLRRLIGWMTAWSFDRLRIWAETGVEPETWSLLSVFAVWRRDRPRAARCRRERTDRPAGARGGESDALGGAPESLSRLGAP
jgi:uncharacterized protein YndB with AHSA1/START domain